MVFRWLKSPSTLHWFGKGIRMEKLRRGGTHQWWRLCSSGSATKRSSSGDGGTVVVIEFRIWGYQGGGCSLQLRGMALDVDRTSDGLWQWVDSEAAWALLEPWGWKLWWVGLAAWGGHLVRPKHLVLVSAMIEISWHPWESHNCQQISCPKNHTYENIHTYINDISALRS